MRFYYVYILRCADESYYIGMTNSLERRLLEHRLGQSGYTNTRLPIKLEWSVTCTNATEAIRIEKQLKGWSRRKKKALIDERRDGLVEFSKNYTQNEHVRIKNPSSTGSD